MIFAPDHNIKTVFVIRYFLYFLGVTKEVVKFRSYRCWNGDEAVFVKLCFFNVKGSFPASITMELQPKVFFDSECTSRQKDDGDIAGQIFQVIF